MSVSADSIDEKGYTPVHKNEDLATVLLVEDTEDNRQMMGRLLELSGFRVVEATNGEEAVEADDEHAEALECPCADRRYPNA